MKFETLRTFANLPHIHRRTDGWREKMRDQADKVHEEAGELMVESKSYIDAVLAGEDDWLMAQCRAAMVDEIADVVQSLANLCECMEVTDYELIKAVEACDAKNAIRGRF